MEFEKFLIDNKIVLKDKAKYYVDWADKFLHGINYRAEAIDQRTISCFLNSMSKDNRYEDWQIRQAAGFKIKIFSRKGTEAQR